RRDGEVVRLADDLEILDVDLVSARRARIGAGGAGDDDRGLLRQMIGNAEQFLAHSRLRHHRLDESGAVTDDEKVDLPAGAAVVKPAFEGDFFAFVFADVFDVYLHRSSKTATKSRKPRNQDQMGFSCVSCFRGYVVSSLSIRSRTSRRFLS